VAAIVIGLRRIRKGRWVTIRTFRGLRHFTAKSSIVTFGACFPTVRHVGKWAGGVFIASIAALTACSGSGATAASTGSTSLSAAATTPRSATTVRPRTTTTTTIPEFSFDDSVPPPKLINTGTNYVAILKSLEAYANWEAAHRPDADLVSTTIARGTRLHDRFSVDLANLRANGARLIENIGAPSVVTIISVRPDAFSARIVEDVRLHKTVDSGGRVTSSVRYSQPTTYQVLVVHDGGYWRVAAFDVELENA
jgi:hypothetical protein